MGAPNVCFAVFANFCRLSLAHSWKQTHTHTHRAIHQRVSIATAIAKAPKLCLSRVTHFPWPKIPPHRHHQEDRLNYSCFAPSREFEVELLTPRPPSKSNVKKEYTIESAQKLCVHACKCNSACLKKLSQLWFNIKKGESFRRSLRGGGGTNGKQIPLGESTTAARTASFH